MDGDLLSLVEADKLPVHPLAGLFPMLPDDELADLADDIKENGLIHAVILDHAGAVLVDGRNRLAACRLAGIEPRFEYLAEGVEPRDYIAGVNLRRRNMTAGQRAMALAMLYPEPKRGVHSEFRGGTGDVSKARLSYARAVLQHAPELAQLVLVGSSLDAAYQTVRDREQAAASEEAKLARLRAEAPDVADLVVEGTITLAAGLAELDERARTKRNTIESGRRSAERIASGFAADAIAILSAIELGEAIQLDKGQQAQIKQTLKLLSKEGVLT